MSDELVEEIRAMLTMADSQMDGIAACLDELDSDSLHPENVTPAIFAEVRERLHWEMYLRRELLKAVDSACRTWLREAGRQ